MTDTDARDDQKPQTPPPNIWTRVLIGRDFARLWIASAASSVGDGAILAAGPLLVASRTRDPALVAGAAFASQLPWLLFSVISGVYIDRLDRRHVVVAANALQAVAIGGLGWALLAGAAPIPVMYLAFFLVGIGDVLVSNASVAMLPSVVTKESLSPANARLQAVDLLGYQLGGPPLGAYLFVVAVALPFGFDAVTFIASAVLMATLRGAAHAGVTAVDQVRQSVRSEVAEGLRWLRDNPTLRLLAACICVMNITYMSVLAVYVLYAQERLGLDALGYGALLTTSAMGGLLGTVIATRVETRFGPGNILRVGLLIEAATNLSLAVIRSPWLAAIVMAIFGIHAVLWVVITTSLRQGLVPTKLLGRVEGVYNLFRMGASAVGAVVGGILAHTLGITAPFWFAGVVVTILAAATWRLFAPQTLMRGAVTS